LNHRKILYPLTKNSRLKILGWNRLFIGGLNAPFLRLSAERLRS
jgi:hypothetical protein